MRNGLKLRISDIVAISATLAIVQIYSLPDFIRNIIRLECILVCLIYLLLNVTKLIKSRIVGIVLFLLVVAVAAVVNHYPNNANGLRNTIIYISSVFCSTSTILVICKTRRVEDVVKTILKPLLLLWLINTISIFNVGPGDNGGYNEYFIGNKFNAAYLNILILTFLVISRKNHSNRIGKGVFIFWLSSAIESVYMTCYTGLVMLFTIGILFVVNNKLIPGFHAPNLNKILKKPIIIVLSILVSGWLAFGLEAILQLNLVKNILETVGKSQTMGSRLVIYTYLLGIIQNKPVLGYGYDTDIVTKTYAANAQNGLVKIIIENGFIGCAAFILMVFSLIKFSNRTKDAYSQWVLYVIYAYIVSCIVEINFSSYFIFILVFYYLLSIDNVTENVASTVIT